MMCQPYADTMGRVCSIHPEELDQALMRASTPSLLELTAQTEIPLTIANVVKILNLFKRTHSASNQYPENVVLRYRLSVFGSWVDQILDKYDELSIDSCMVVDLFVSDWTSKGTPTVV